MGTLDKIQPYEIERARKIVRKHCFEGLLEVTYLSTERELYILRY
nr:MAG TPA: hypothetical protein [Caudoviricetes sp.]